MYSTTTATASTAPSPSRIDQKETTIGCLVATHPDTCSLSPKFVTSAILSLKQVIHQDGLLLQQPSSMEVTLSCSFVCSNKHSDDTAWQLFEPGHEEPKTFTF